MVLQGVRGSFGNRERSSELCLRFCKKRVLKGAQSACHEFTNSVQSSVLCFQFWKPYEWFCDSYQEFGDNFFYQKLSKSNLLLQENDDVFFSLAKDFVRRDLQK